MKNIIENIDFTEYFKVHSPGYVIEIYNNGLEYEYILGNRVTNPKVEKTTSDTLYDIASLTKVFTAVLTYMAYEEEKIDLNDTVYNIDNSFIHLKDVRIIDLLSHNQNIWTNGYLGNVKSKTEFYHILYTAYVKEKIPTYVDTHYIILGVLLEKIYQKPYAMLCQEKIFNPLDMVNTTFDPDASLCASNNYELLNNKIVDGIYPGLIHDTKGRVAKKSGLNLGHASIFTTGSDLLKFLKTFLDNKLLKKETITFMLEHRNTNEDNSRKLKEATGEEDINIAYAKSQTISLYLPKPYNNMGVRHRNAIAELNDVPIKASNNSVTFSGYTGTLFTIDFNNKIIVVIMCNIIHNSRLSKEVRKSKTVEILNKIFDNLI